MGNINIKDKLIQQAQMIRVLQVQGNFLIRELYKLKPDHEVFIKNPELAKTLKGVIENEQRRLDELSKQRGEGSGVKK